MLLDTILAPKDERDPFLKLKLQVLAVSEQRMGHGATVEDVVYNLIPGVASRSVMLPPSRHRAVYGRALADVTQRLRARGGVIVSTDQAACAIRYHYRDAVVEKQFDTVHVRLLYTDVSFMQIAGEASEHADDPPVDFAQVRVEITEIIEKDTELPETARKGLLVQARNPSFPVSELTLRYARAKKDKALLLLAEAHAERCARAAYAAQRELSYSEARAAYPLPPWAELSDEQRSELVGVTTKVICGQTKPYALGGAYGPMYLGVVQQTLMHIVGSGPQYEREREGVAVLRAVLEDPRGLT